MSTGDPAPSQRHRCLWLTKGLGRGGVERLLLDMLPLVDRNRFEVEVAYVLPWKDNYHRPMEELGTTVHCLGSSAGAKDVRWIARLGRLLAERRFDVVHSHAPVPGIAGRVLTMRPNGPVMIHTEHNVWDRYRRPTRVLNSLTYRRNSGAIAVSGVVADSIRPFPPAPNTIVRTVHHGTVLDSIQVYGQAERDERRRRLSLPTDRFLIGNVGNFTPKKDHHTLLRALSGTGPIADAHLVLIGLGPLEEELRAEVDRLGLGERVTFLGSRGDVFELLPLMDLFCLSSEFEGFPIALVEAMATGLPCVATTVGGIPEIIVDGDNGLLVPPKDPAALGRAIGRVMADDVLATSLGKRAKEDAAALDLRNAVRDLQDVYLEAMGAGGR